MLYHENHTKKETGQFSSAQILSGITLSVYDIQKSEALQQQNKPSQTDGIRMSHCQEGRLSCDFADGSSIALTEGELAVNHWIHSAQNTYFPLGRYYGISIDIALHEAEPSVHTISQALLGKTLSLYEIFSKYPTDSCTLMQNEPMVHAIFSVLYQISTLPEASQTAYMRLKVMELLLFLSHRKSTDSLKSYLYREQIQKTKAVHEYLIQNLEHHITLEQLARQFHISLTMLKKSFKTVYGAPVSTYMRTYRLHTAKQLLLHSSQSIAEIAQSVGYESPSRFSAVFKQYYHCTPNAMRRVLFSDDFSAN